MILKKNVKMLAALLLISAVATAVWSVADFSQKCESVCGEVLRLHVIASSDGESDQALKLLVRDAVLESGADIFNGSVNADNAEKALAPRLKKLEEAAENTLRKNGADYGASVRLVNEFFVTRSYDGITLPAGKYKAVKVVLGEGEGKNWWCVMFPPLCLPAASETSIDAFLSEDEVKLVESSPQYEVRFKIVEICGKISNFFAEKMS